MTYRTLGCTVLLVLAACSGDPGSSVPDPAAPAASPGGGGNPPGTNDPGNTSNDPGSSSTPRLTVVVEGTGRVLSTPAGIDCPGTCTATFAPGTKVSLATTPAEGWKLDAWKGDCSGASCAVTVTKETKVTSALKLIDARWDPSVGIADCAAAWGTAGEKLSPCDTVKDDYVVVHKSKRNLALCKTGKLVKNLRTGLGFAPSGDKTKQGDGKTPEGVFYIPRLLPNSSYYKAFLLSYPSVEDAQRGVTSGLISANERSMIVSAHSACVEPPQDTALGGEIEIHGNGSKADWTLGCVAVEDSGVDLLWSAIGVGDSIVVVP